jgi:EmrB/QacA subfamily drug resistance transporter
MAIPARSYAAFGTVMLAFFLAILDSTIVNITLPRITEHFRTDLKSISWVVNGFALAFAVPLITASRLADQFGRKRIFCVGLALFTLTSLLVGLAPTVNLLVFFRVLQGLAAAMVVPVTLPIVLDLFPVEKSGTVIGAWAAIAGLAAASGPALGGIISEKIAWQWIFYINIPIGLLALVLALFLIRETKDPTASHRIDWSGMASLTAAAFSLVYGLIKANDLGWTSPTILGLFACSALSLALFTLAERRSPEPMLPLGMLRSLPFSAGNATLFVLGMGMMNGVFFLAFFLTQVMGKTELEAGIVITALPLSSTVFSAIAGALSDRLGSRWFTTAGMAIVAASVWIYSGLRPTATNGEIVWRLVVMGAGIGTAMAPVVGSTVRAVAADKIGVASGVGNMARTVGTVLGVAIIVTAFTARVDRQIEWAKGEAQALVAANDALRDQIKRPILDRLSRVKFSQSGKLATLEQTLAQVDAKKAEVLATVPPFMAKKMAVVFEEQKAEIRVLHPKLQSIFKARICDAFASTFQLNALLLIVGVFFALFSDKGRKQRR